MNGKIVFCFAVVFVGQAISAPSTTGLDSEDLKKILDQFTQSSLSITNHMMGYTNSGDAQKSYDKVKGLVSKGIADLETEVSKLKETVRKSVDPKISEKYDELEKEFKKQMTDAKVMFDEKIGKPLNEKYEFKKISDTILKSTKDFETNVNKAIDGVKKQ